MATNSVAAQSSAYLQSIVDFVKDVKPYHTKLSIGGAISELYFFSNEINVNITEARSFKAFIGADLMPETPSLGVRQRQTFSWAQERISDGVRRVWPIALMSNPKFASQASLEKFVAGQSDVNNIPGLSLGVYDVKRWDGPGITRVSKNSVHQQDTINYTLSHGVYSFDVLNTREWIQSNIDGINDIFSGNPSDLRYLDVARRGGTITNITGETYEEFKLVCTSAPTLSVLTVYSSVDNFTTSIGTVEFGNTFTLYDGYGKLRIQFTYTYAPNQTDDVALLGDTWYLTPANAITVSNGNHPSYPLAPVETWSLIKCNPIIFVPGGQPIFTPAVARTDTPAIEIHTCGSEFTPASTWSITFRGNGTYELRSSLPGYFNDTGVPLSLVNGCSYKDNNISFTIIPTETGWHDGDIFSWTIAESKANYKVYGSVSGWQPDAYVGRWYWNGKIGFKIPSLDYFTNIYTATIAVSNDGVQNSWESVVSNSQVLNNVSYDYGAFFATGNSSIVAASQDGLDWDQPISSVFQPPPGSDQILVAVGAGGSIATTTDGNTWITQNSGVDVNLNKSTTIPNFLSSTPSGPNDLNCIIVVGDSGTIITSVNGVGWSLQNSGVGFNLYDVTWSNDAIIAVGAGGTVLRSLDRITWTSITSNTTDVLRSVIYEPTSNVFTAVGDNGVIIRSTDGGLTWSNLGTFSNGTFSSIAYGNGLYIAVGPTGFVASSADGISWTRYSGRPFNSIAFGNNRFVAVGGSPNLQVDLTPVHPVSMMAEPSVYTITFVSGSDSTNNIPGKAIVHNNIYGYRSNLLTGTETNPVTWSDEYVAFQLNASPGVFEFSTGDIVHVYIAPTFTYPANAAYDILPYEDPPYDSGSRNTTVPLYFNELFPLYHSYGAVIFPTISSGDEIIIDKAFFDKIRFRVVGAAANFPELAAENDWIPLQFKVYDTVTGTAPNYTPASTADFSDLNMWIEAYTASTGQKVFTVLAPRYLKSDRAASATLTIDPTFFSNYMPFNTKYSISVEPDQLYGQTLRVKVTENLKIYRRIFLVLTDPITITISDSPITSWETVGELSFIDVANINFVEGGALDYNLVDWPPATQTASPSFSVEDNQPDSASTTFTEGLTILQTAVDTGDSPQAEPAGTTHLTVIYDFNLTDVLDNGNPVGKVGLSIAALPGSPNADFYTIKMLNVPSGLSNSWIAAPESDLNATISGPMNFTHDEIDTGTSITDLNSFDLDNAANLSGVTAPFRLWIV